MCCVKCVCVVLFVLCAVCCVLCAVCRCAVCVESVCCALIFGCRVEGFGPRLGHEPQLLAWNQETMLCRVVLVVLWCVWCVEGGVCCVAFYIAKTIICIAIQGFRERALRWL